MGALHFNENDKFSGFNLSMEGEMLISVSTISASQGDLGLF